MSSFGKLVLARGGEDSQEFALEKSPVTLGRATNEDIVLRDAKVSRTHARIQCDERGCRIVDLDSANGTFINGARVSDAALSPGDVIVLGDSALRYETTPLQSATEITPLNSEAELDATLVQATVQTQVNDTGAPSFVVHTSARTWEVTLTSNALTIGRLPDNDLQLDLADVSRHHARIERAGEAFLIRDLRSTNGTWLGEERIQEHTLTQSETIRIGAAQLLFKPAIDSNDLTLVDAPARVTNSPRRPVVIVPGFMGSELWRGDTRLWPNPRLLFTHPEMLRLPDTESIEPRGVLREVVIVPNLIKLDEYNRLGDNLEESLGYARERDLIEFAYDWRQDVREPSRHLAETNDRWNVGAPITIIAHSLGCLVTRYYVEHLGGNRQVGRLILLGGPHAGTPRAMVALFSGLSILPFGLMGERMRQVLATFPSLNQILPTYACATDQAGAAIELLSDESWLAQEQRPLLENAREFRRELGTHSSVPTISIFGYGLKTVTSASVQRDSQGRWEKVNFNVEPAGDGTIPERSAIMEASEIHPVQQYHGTLFVDNDVKMRLKLELTK